MRNPMPALFSTLSPKSPLAGLSVAAVLCSTFVPRTADAACTADEECGAGFTCEEVGSGACPAIACAPDQECEEPACEPEVIKECIQAPCDPDGPSDQCGDEMVCHTETYEACSGQTDVACPEGEECLAAPMPEPPDCVQETYSQCMFPHQLPCEAASDCGAGFECVAAEICSCSGSAGSAGAPTPDGEPDAPDGGASERVPAPETMTEPDCSCAPSDYKYCKAEEVACDDTSNCREGWTCEVTAVSMGGCARPANGSDDSCADEPTTVEERHCVPPGWGIAVDGVGQSDSASGGIPTAGLGNGQSSGESGPSIPPSDRGSDDDVNTIAEESDGMAASDAGGGCSIGRSHDAQRSGMTWLAAGLIGLLFRRRRS